MAVGERASISTLRERFPILETSHYVAACSHAPLSTTVEAALDRYMQSWRAAGNPWEPDWYPARGAARTQR